MIKKVVVAAAGQGTRMLELSNDKSKHLICVEQRPFLAYLLDNLVSSGYRDIILVVGFKKELMEDFKNKFLNCSDVIKKVKPEEIKIQIVDQYETLGPKEKEYGTACPVKCVKDIIGKDSFIYVFGDNLFSVEDLGSMNIDDEFCYIAGLLQEHPEKYGVLIENGDDFLDKIVEKPKEFVGNLINAGLYKFTNEVFDKLPLIKKSPRGEYEITDVISLLATERRVKIKKIKDYWHDFGNPEDVEKLSKFIKNGCRRVETETN
jgi:bifunctional UDP-N-acetylglucosamine pyrophosphorylase/glucosamine-1-phosphate N-acetyltransferase